MTCFPISKRKKLFPFDSNCAREMKAESMYLYPLLLLTQQKPVGGNYDSLNYLEL